MPLPLFIPPFPEIPEVLPGRWSRPDDGQETTGRLPIAPNPASLIADTTTGLTAADWTIEMDQGNLDDFDFVA